MSHPIEIAINSYLKDVQDGRRVMDPMTLAYVTKNFLKAMEKQFKERRTPGRISMSSMGKPTCQLIAERDEWPAEADDPTLLLKMVVGDTLEMVLLGVIMEALEAYYGGESIQVTLDLGDALEVNGTLDVMLFDEVWDIKTASPYAFENKFESFTALKKNDDFGYVEQLFGYAKAKNKRPGGWIVMNKVTGQIKVVVCDASQEEIDEVLNKTAEKIKYVKDGGEFYRCFEDEEEAFRKVPTGRRVLPSTCTFCKFKTTCWPEAKYLPNPSSTAKVKPYKWYTKYEDE